MSVYKTIKRFKNRLFYGSDVSPLEYNEPPHILPCPYVQINIDNEKDDLSSDPFYGDKAVKKRIEGETSNKSKEK